MITQERKKEIAAMVKAREDFERTQFDATIHGLAVKLNAGKGTEQDRKQFNARVEKEIGTRRNMPLFWQNEEEFWYSQFLVMKASSDAGLAEVKRLRSVQEKIVAAACHWFGRAEGATALLGKLDHDQRALLTLVVSPVGMTAAGEPKPLSLREVAAVLNVGLATLRDRIENLRGILLNANAPKAVVALLDAQTKRKPRGTGGTKQKKD